MRQFIGSDNITMLSWEYNKWFLIKHKCKTYFERLFGLSGQTLNHSLDDFYYRPTAAAWRSLVEKIRPKVVLVEYAFLSWLFLDVPAGTKKVLDTHDVFTDRNFRMAAQGRAGNWFSLSRAAERTALNRASEVLAIQDRENQFFREELRPQSTVSTVGHLMAPIDIKAPTSPNVIGYFASSNGNNIYAMECFFNTIWPAVLAENPSIVLMVAGSFCDVFSKSYPNVRYLGRVQNPAEFYSLVSFTINPMIAGTGLKIKTLESMLHGRPVIATPVAADGLEVFDGRGLFISKIGVEFGKAIVRVAGSQQLCRSAAEGCTEAATQYYTEHRQRFLSIVHSKENAPHSVRHRF